MVSPTGRVDTGKEIFLFVSEYEVVLLGTSIFMEYVYLRGTFFYYIVVC